MAKLLKFAWLDGNFPLTIAVSAISDFTDDPALVIRRPSVSLLSTAELLPSYHQAPVDGSL